MIALRVQIPTARHEAGIKLHRFASFWSSRFVLSLYLPPFPVAGFYFCYVFGDEASPSWTLPGRPDRYAKTRAPCDKPPGVRS